MLLPRLVRRHRSPLTPAGGGAAAACTQERETAQAQGDPRTCMGPLRLRWDRCRCGSLVCQALEHRPTLTL
jgi:hypothetical protein